MADIFLDKNTGWSKIPSLAEKMHAAADPPALPGTGGQVTRENIVRWGAEQGRANNPPGSERA